MANDDIVYLISTAGHPNYGDELIAAAWLRFLADRRPEARVWLDCPQPGRAAVLLDGLHPNLRVTDTLWRVTWQADGDDRAAAHARARELVTHYGTPREDLGIEIAAQAASIHLIGGGHLTSQWRANLLLPTLASQLHRLHGMPVHMTGTGLLPVEDEDAALLTEAFADFTHLDVRDAESAARFGLPHGQDDAFLGLASGATRADARPTPAGMLLLQGDLHDREAMSAVVTRALGTLRAEGLEGEEIGVVEAIPPDDSWLLEQVREEWEGPVRFFPFGEVWKEGLPVRPDQVWITSRFHVHLVGASFGARGIAVNTGLEYYRIKHASLSDLGTGWTVVSADAEWDAPAVADGFPAKAQEFAKARAAVAHTIYPPVSRVDAGMRAWGRKR